MALAAKAIERGLDGRTRDAAAEVERILDAALEVICAAEPDSPRVADIIAAAGTSNQAFYRYFAGKDDVILAVMDRGVQRLRSYLTHQMGKETEPDRQVVRWIEGVLAQSKTRRISLESRAVTRQVYAIQGRRVAEATDIRETLGLMLVTPMRQAGASNPRVDAFAVHDVTMGALNRHIAELAPATPAEVSAVVEFCLAGAGLLRRDRVARGKGRSRT